MGFSFKVGNKTGCGDAKKNARHATGLSPMVLNAALFAQKEAEEVVREPRTMPG
jgi:hypothetical protein